MVGYNHWGLFDSVANMGVTIIKAEEGKVYVVVNKVFKLVQGSLGEENVW